MEGLLVRWQRWLFVLAAAAVAVFIAQILTPAVLVFATVAQGTMSHIDEPRQVVVRTATAWQAL